jgi:hypothetical protein
MRVTKFVYVEKTDLVEIEYADDEGKPRSMVISPAGIVRNFQYRNQAVLKIVSSYKAGFKAALDALKSAVDDVGQPLPGERYQAGYVDGWEAALKVVEGSYAAVEQVKEQ